MIHKPNEPLTQLNNQSHDITSLLSYTQKWEALTQEITSTSEATRGVQPPSGTAFRLVEALRVESHSLFEMMRENKGLYVEEMLREFIIPYLKKEIRKKHSIVAELTKDSADKVDTHYINSLVKEQLDQIEAEGRFVDPEQVLQEIESAKERLLAAGTTREQKISEDLYKDFEWEAVFDITDESTDKDAVLTSLNTIFQVIAQNPMVLQDPNAKMVFNKILEEVGVISPVEFTEVEQQAQQPQQPQQQPVNVGANNEGS